MPAPQPTCARGVGFDLPEPAGAGARHTQARATSTPPLRVRHVMGCATGKPTGSPGSQLSKGQPAQPQRARVTHQTSLGNNPCMQCPKPASAPGSRRQSAAVRSTAWAAAPAAPAGAWPCTAGRATRRGRAGQRVSPARGRQSVQARCRSLAQQTPAPGHEHGMQPGATRTVP